VRLRRGSGFGAFSQIFRVDFVVFHPFHEEDEKDWAWSFLTLSVKML
jgi:hypothetical protein